MTRTLTLFTTISCVIFFTSCQKDSNGDLPATTDKVKTYTEDVSLSSGDKTVVTYNLTYDNDNRITAMISSSNPGDKFVYTYTSANSFSSDLYTGGVLGIHHETYMVNNRLDSTFQYNDTEDTLTEKYIYNSAGQYIKSYQYHYSKLTGSQVENTITYTYDANGNQVKEEGTDTNVSTYEFYPDLVYEMPLIGPTPVPAVKRQLVKSLTMSSNGYLVGTITYTYTFDSNDRVSTQNGVTDDGSVIIKTYTYY